jgi:large subunit ribosomal protein L35
MRVFVSMAHRKKTKERRFVAGTAGFSGTGCGVSNMGKLKTKKGVAKRFRTTKKGKLKYSTCGKSHLMSCKNRKRLRRLKQSKLIEGANAEKYLKRMLPYG